MAWIVERAVELRTTGLLVRWQSDLAAYPEPLREKLIEANTRVWQPAARHGRALDLLPPSPAPGANPAADLGHPQRAAAGLRDQPPLGAGLEVAARGDPRPAACARADGRADRARLHRTTLEERVRTDFELIRDALALAPTSAGIEQARATIRECLAQSDESR